METQNFLRRPNFLLRWRPTLAFSLVTLLPAAALADTRVAFDLPETIECRDATPADFAQAHPTLKVIEAKFRISARMIAGETADVVDFVYVLTSPDKMLRFQDYLPNTTLESTVADDQIEITDASEKCLTTGAEAHVVYKPVTIGATHSNNSKKSESSHYKQIAPKETVLSSGTINREHGVFFRMRPSRSAALEGAKEFTFLATVPASWRGDVCSISCTARAKKSSLLSQSVVTAGEHHVQLGLYLAGDQEAAGAAERLRHAQEGLGIIQAARPPKENVFGTLSNQTVGLFTGKKADSQSARRQKDLETAERALIEAQQELRQLAR